MSFGMLYAMLMRYVALMFGASLAASGQSGPNHAQNILETNCASCHGAAQMSGLDLRQRDTMLKGGKRGPAIVPGKPAESLLFRAVTHEGDLQMPPGKKALPAEDIARLKSWIEAGAPWEAAQADSALFWPSWRKRNCTRWPRPTGAR
jgi:mono/diheme cytochrome c family protein